MSFVEEADGWHLSPPAPLVFEFDSETVASGARDSLLRIARELRELGIERTLVRGHTDNVGTREYNLALSKASGRRRGQKVLAEGGFPPTAWSQPGSASTCRWPTMAPPEGRAKNQRVVIIVQAG